VVATFHHADNVHKLLEVIGLCRDEWMFFEERDDQVGQFRESPHRIPAQTLMVIVSSSMTPDLTTFEESLQ
jgi:hypothetical protein